MTFCYPPRRLIGDYLRVGAGLACTLVPLVFLPVMPVVFWVLLLLAVLFAGLGFVNVVRHLTRVELDASGIRVRPWGRALAWETLDGFRLAYFSTRRDGRQGWLQLTLRAPGRCVRLDSRLEGFDDVLRVAFGATKTRALSLDPATCSNLRDVGLEVFQPHPADARLAL